MQKMYILTIKNSSILAVSVAIAAPRIPSAGAPRLPKISTQFKNTFVQNDVIFTTTDIFTSSILLIQHIIVLLRPNKIYAKPIIRRYDIPAAIISSLFEYIPITACGNISTASAISVEMTNATFNIIE